MDKLIIFAFCLAFYIQGTDNLYIIVPVITAVTISALNSYFNRTYVCEASFSAYALLCFAQPLFLPFLPLMCYDILFDGLYWRRFLLLSLLPVAVNISDGNIMDSIFIISITVITLLVKYRTISFEKVTSEYTKLRDSAKEFSMQLEMKNKELMEKQDYETNLATLNERNRIAHEIHDTIGHLLSSSILQIGALMVVCRDEAAKKNLDAIKTTLSQGMDSIRNSIHNLHEESIDLYTEIQRLVENFSFCEVTFDYDLKSNPDKKLKYSFISIIKESLANVIKHSDATNVNISLQEHPALYQLVIKDNGTKKFKPSEDGIGLKNMTERVTGLGGIFNYSSEKGFKIFISVPKQQNTIRRST